MLSGREGVERFPPGAELPFADAVARQLKQLDRRVATDAVRALVEGRPELDVRRALALTRRTRPDDVLAFFTAKLGRRIGAEVVTPRSTIRPVPSGVDPYQ